jgi:phage shock protein C
MEKKLYRDEHHKVISGVCAGLADYFGIDVSIVRLVFVLTLVLKGGGGLLYIILWIVLPKKPFSYIPPVDYTVPPTPGSPYQQYNAANPYQPTPTFVPQPQKHPTTAALIGGLVLILLGGGFLLDEFDIIPDWRFDQWWPAILVVIGIALIFKGGNKPKPVQAWQQPAEPVQPATEVKEEPSNDHPSTEL